MLAENYLVQPLHFITDQLGLTIDRIERRNQIAVAPVDISTPALSIAKGTAGSVSFAWTAIVNGEPFYTVEVFWYVGAEMRPPIATSDDFWTIAIEGRPSTRITLESKASIANNRKSLEDDPIPPGYLTTVMAMIHSIPIVTDATPGLLLPTMPEIHWKPIAHSTG